MHVLSHTCPLGPALTSHARLHARRSVRTYMQHTKPSAPLSQGLDVLMSIMPQRVCMPHSQLPALPLPRSIMQEAARSAHRSTTPAGVTSLHLHHARHCSTRRCSTHAVLGSGFPLSCHAPLERRFVHASLPRIPPKLPALPHTATPDMLWHPLTGIPAPQASTQHPSA